MRRFGYMIVLLGLAACSGTTEPRAAMSGAWSGAISGQEVVKLSLVESGGTVTGNGTLTNSLGGVIAISVTGTFSNPAFSLNVASAGLAPFNFQGQYNPSVPPQLVGTVSGSGFDGQQLVMNKQ